MSDQKIKKLANGCEVLYPFRSLKNYKEVNKKTAESKGVLKSFLSAPTLTSAKKILAGSR
jgi:hypothetical protein